MANRRQSAGDSNVSDSTSQTGQQGFPPPVGGLSFSAFEHPGVVLVKACATVQPFGYWDATGIGLYQGEDGPVHLVVGDFAEEEQLQRAHRRFGVTVDELRRFRDGAQLRCTTKGVRHG